MALSNHEPVGKALEVLIAGLPKFIERELKNAHGARCSPLRSRSLGRHALYLCWQSILEQETELNLDKSQSRQELAQKAT